MSSPDFVMFPWPRARDGYTHSGRFTLNGQHYWVEARIVPATEGVAEHFEGRLTKAAQSEKKKPGEQRELPL